MMGEKSTLKFLKPRQLAEQLSLPEGTVYGMLRRGEIRALRSGVRFLIPVTERDRLLSAGKLEEGAE